MKQNIGVLGMKSLANGILLRSKTVMPIECLHYALNLPTSVVITGIDSMEILEQAFEAVRTFQPMNDEQVRSLLAKTAEAASRGEFEPFKTSSIFDSTAQNPDWLGEEPQRIQQLMSARSFLRVVCGGTSHIEYATTDIFLVSFAPKQNSFLLKHFASNF